MWRRTLTICWIAQVLSLAGFGFGVPFLPFFIQELGVTDPDDLRLWTGLLSSAPALTMAAIAPVWGLLADRLGKKVMMLRAMLAGSIILASFALVHSVSTVFVLRVVQGLFTGTVTASAALVASSTPKERLSYALGVLSSSNFIGISLGPMLGGISAEWFGYRPSFVIGAGILAAGFVLVLFVLKEERTEATADPVEDGVSGGAGGRRQAPGEEIGGSGRAAAGWRAFVTVSMMGSLAMLLLLRFARALPVPFLPLYVQELRGTIEGAASATGFVSAGRGAVTALAALTITRLGDRHDKLRIITVLLGVTALLTFPLVAIDSLVGFSLLLIVATFFLGGIEPLLQADLSSRIPARRRGLLFGFQTTVGNLGWFAAPLIGSAVSIRFGIASVFLTLAVFLGITMGIAAMLSQRGARRAR